MVLSPLQLLLHPHTKDPGFESIGLDEREFEFSRVLVGQPVDPDPVGCRQFYYDRRQ